MGSNALAFLKTVLPDSGWYAAFTKINEQRKYNRFFATIEELAHHIAVEDGQGKTVYHACASFVEPGHRFANKAWGAKSFWLDIDAGKDNSPYATAVDAARAVFQFTHSARLPPPLFVGSGFGVHCYWPLHENLGPEDWLLLAGGLKGAAQHFGLHADPSRTTDLASVLRTPGTHNRKLSEMRPVECGLLIGAWPYHVEHFDCLLPYGNGDRNIASVNNIRSEQLPALTQALIVEPDYAPVRADEIADQCAQVRWLRDAKGCTPEPHWYAVLGVLSRCEDGQEKAHEWSRGHAQYSAQETQAKYERTFALTGATTCTKFESVNFRSCQGCPFKGRIVSPISLRAASPVAEQLELFAGSVLQLQIPGELRQEIGNAHPTLPLLPPPFEWSQGSQLVIRTEKSDGNPTTALVSHFPIFLAGIGVGEVHTDKFSLQFKQWLPHRGWFEIHVGAGKLFGQGGGSELAERGANIHDHKTFLHYVRLASDRFHASERLRMQYDQCGWKSDYTGFLVGDALYTEMGVQENVTVNQELHTRAQWLGPQAGTLAGWSGAANALFAAGCEAQSFALACTFAAVLMRLQATDEGGAVVNLLSRGSGTGKSTALAAVYTAWGRQQGLTLTKIDTRVAQAITLGALGNLPIVYDELGNRDPEMIREFITMFTNGRDKMRGDADGSIRHKQAAWQTLMVSGSNISIHDILSLTGGSDALAYRVLEFICALPEGVVAAKGDQLRKDMEANAGWAGDAYVDYLMQPGVMAWVQEKLPVWTAELWDKCGNRPEHRFWMRTIGAVAVAGTLVNNIGILQFSPNRIVEWALGSLTTQTNRSEDTAAHNIQRSIGVFGEFLSTMIDSVIVVRKAFVPGARTRELPLVTPRRALSMRYELDTRRLLISDKTFRQWLLERGIGSREVLDDLERIELIKSRRRFATLSAGTDVVGAQQSCIEIDGNHPAVSGTLVAVTPATVQQDNQPATA